MADKHTERALASQRQRHLDQAREAATRLQDYATLVLRDIEGGSVSWNWHLVADAVDLERRLAALEALRETGGIYEAELADRDKPAG